MTKTTIRLAALLFGSLLGWQPAEACRVSSSQTSIIHERVPDNADSGSVILQVEIVGVFGASPWTYASRARVTKVVQGRYDQDYITLRQQALTSCDFGVVVGQSGFVIGKLQANAAGEIGLLAISSGV